jgi:hypothetical protein
MSYNSIKMLQTSNHQKDKTIKIKAFITNHQQIIRDKAREKKN